MLCHNIRNKLAEYSLGGLKPRQRETIRAHLETCVTCARELAALERTAALLESVRLEEPPPEVGERVRAGIRPRSAWALYARRAATFAGVLAVLLVSLLLFRPASPPADFSADQMIRGHAAASWNDPLSNRTALGLDIGLLASRGEP